MIVCILSWNAWSWYTFVCKYSGQNRLEYGRTSVFFLRGLYWLSHCISKILVSFLKAGLALSKTGDYISQD